MRRQLSSLLESIYLDVDRKLKMISPHLNESAESEPTEIPQDDPFSLGVGGNGGATNGSTAQQDMESYLMNIVDEMCEKFDISVDNATEHVLNCAEKASENGMLPPLPPNGAPDTETYMWIARAATSQFGGYCAKEAVADDLEPDVDPYGAMNAQMGMGGQMPSLENYDEYGLGVGN